MATKKGVVEVVAWGNVSQQWKITQIVLTQQGRIQEFFIGGGGGVQTLVQKGLLNFFVANYFFPHPLPPITVARYKSLAPYVYLNSTRKGMHPWNILPLCRNCRPAEKAETTTCFSICECRSPMAREILLCEQRRTDHRRVPENNYISEYPWKLV